ncbi:MAG: tetratricopeptide repeat protein [Lacibacter sp.]|nr:tetratricopeptide repeat protein [Lacibacter sp.]
MKKTILKSGLILFFFISGTNYFVSAQSSNVDSLLRVLKTSKEDTAKVNLLVKIARLYRYKNTDTAFLYSKKALVLAEKLSFEEGIADACVIKGALFADGANYEDGLRTVQRAIMILEKMIARSSTQADSQFLAKIGGAYNVAGHNTIAKGDLNQGLKYSLLALKARTKAGHKRGVCETEYNIGTIFFELSNYDEALKHYQVSLQLAEEIKRPPNIAFALNAIGDVYAKKGADSLALFYQQKALKAIEGLDDQVSESEILKNMAMLQAKKGDYANAVNNLTTSLKLSHQIQVMEPQAYKHALLGGIYIKLNNFNLATLHLDTALALSKKAGDVSVLKETYLNLFRLDSARGNYKDAIKNYQLSVFYGDSLINVESNKKLLQQEMQYKFDYKEDSLKQAHLITSTKLVAQKKQNIFYLLGAGLLALLLFFGYLNYTKLQKISLLSKVAYQKEKDELQLKSQQDLLQDRLRISRDLHDEIGATLSGINMYSYMTKNDIDRGDVISAGNSVNIIQTSSAEMVNKLNDIIWFIKPQNEAMEAVIEKLKLYAAEMAAVKNMALKFEASTDALDLNFSLEVRKNIYLICKEAINNAVKYSDASQLIVEFGVSNNVFIISIQDNGKGYSYDTIKKGNGLDNMFNRASIISGGLAIDTAPEKGCSVKLQFNITR